LRPGRRDRLDLRDISGHVINVAGIIGILYYGSLVKRTPATLPGIAVVPALPFVIVGVVGLHLVAVNPCSRLTLAKPGDVAR
jgi:hypothetical protein